MTVWDDQDDADAYQSTGTYKSLVDKVRGFFNGDPVLKVYHAEGVAEHALKFFLRFCTKGSIDPFVFMFALCLTKNGEDQEAIGK